MKEKALKQNTFKMPVLVLNNFVVFPNSVLYLELNEKNSIEAANTAIQSNQLIFLVSKKIFEKENTNIKNLHKIGVVAKVKQTVQVGGNIKVLVETSARGIAQSYKQEKNYIFAEIASVSEIFYSSNKDYEALLRTAKKIFLAYTKFTIGKIPKDLQKALRSANQSGSLADFITMNLPLNLEDKQEILEELDTAKRLEKALVLTLEETDYLKHELELSAKTIAAMDKNQKEYFLREQQRVISEELGEDEDSTQFEANKFELKIKKLKIPKETKEKLLNECDKLRKHSHWGSDANILRDYIEECVNLPWGKFTKDSIDLAKAQKLLDSEHFGLKDVKERIIELLAIQKTAPNFKGQIICLAGPPGVGKSSIIKSLAKAMGRKFIRVSLGGVKDESEIRGHRKTYVGAMTGRIIAAIKLTKTMNPVILLDEIDKLSKDFKGDPSSALLEVLDTEQNKEFRDHYLEIPFDLSNVLFVATANDVGNIPAPLYDRMEFINHYSYTHEEKFSIAKKHLILKQLKNHGLKATEFKIKNEALHFLIESYTKEAGVRELERKIANIMRKFAKNKLENIEIKKISIDEKTIRDMLGPAKFKKEEINKISKTGIVNGLAWTSVGGDTMPIEVSLMKGKGKVNVTGSLGDVMKESAQIAVSYIRSNAEKFGIDENFYKTMDIHIHAPEGATPKDGPSAGVTMTTALISELGNIPARQDIAMTGEITLKGKVLPIGGLREKTMAAYRAGIGTVIVPKGNENDLQKIDDNVKKNVKFVLAENLEDVFTAALEKNTKKFKNYVIQNDKIKISKFFKV